MRIALMVAVLGVGAVPGAVLQDEKKAEFVSGTVEEMLAAVGPRTGLKFVYAEETGVAKKRVTIPLVTEKTTREELFGILETALQACDLAMIQGEAKGVPALIVPAQAALKRPVPVLGPTDPIPPGNMIYTKVFRLVAIGPREAHSMIVNLTSYPQGTLALESAGALCVTDFAGNLRRIAKVIESVDKGE